MTIKHHYDRTAKTQAPSFTKNFLSTHRHPLVQCISKAREINKAHTTFIDTIIKHEHNGRIHADINQIRSDTGGTVTGKILYSNPSTTDSCSQQRLRSIDLIPLSVPESGCEWGCFDYSQQEPRLVVHYASLDQDTSVFGVKDSYEDGDADFHTIVAKMADIPDLAKTINLGLFYGMGKAKLQAEVGVSKDKVELFTIYHEEFRL